jgi:hypothetical protein
VLRPGGRLAVADVVRVAPLPYDLHDSPGTHAACIAGAASVEEVERMLLDAGFVEIRLAVERGRQLFRSDEPGARIDAYVAPAVIEARKPLDAERRAPSCCVSEDVGA